MFNNFLSNLIFGNTNNYASSEQVTNTNDDLKTNDTNQTLTIDNTNNHVNTTASTLTSDEFDLIDRKDIDWVLVNPFDQNGRKSHKKKLNLSVSLSASGYGLQSLFNEQVVPKQQHQFEDADELESRKKQIVPKSEGGPSEKKKPDQWIITPLPSLRSISDTQRSIVDDSGLENLLIEHPSMSVFVGGSASSEDLSTSSNEAYEVTAECHEQEQEQEQEQEPEEHFVHQFTAHEEIEQVAERFEEMKENFASPTKINKSLKKKKKSKKQSSNKNKKQESQSTTGGASQSSASSSSSSPAKKSIKNYLQGVSGNGQAALAKVAKAGRSNGNLKLSHLLNMNKVVNVNTRQRKYHNLQQPQFTSQFNM